MNNRSLGQVIGLLLLIVAAVYGGYALGAADSSNDAGTTAIEVSTEGDDDRADADADADGDSGEAAEAPVADDGSGESDADSGDAPDEPLQSQSGLPPISIDDLPDEAIDTLYLIDSDGPYPYDKDGSTFQNREGILPDEPRGYYREFTVDTPGLNHRGARRIVGGDGGELYYTSDHYDSFSEIADW